ncbi:type 1 glutamine amidotransferase domain-containing protein [Rhodococcus sovatensis]|uniref:Type 1 glutamine amidotransferase domain-containing protein n=1 Tax=Rhodococcus sovatensis TaxID=1805840 RepID=A0ABZ2PR15_9NOCA
MSKTVLFALTSHAELGDTGRKTGAYAPEFAHPAAVFSDNGYDIEFVSVAGGQAPLDGIKPDDAITQSFLADPAIAEKLSNTPVADALDPADYDVIYFAGGHGTMWDFPGASTLANLAAEIYNHGGVVAAVCHGPSGLLGVTLPDGSPLVQGKTVSSFTNEEEIAVGLNGVVPFLLEDALTDLGAKHQKAENFSVFAVTDTRLVTGQNPASAVEVARQAVDALAE